MNSKRLITEKVDLPLSSLVDLTYKLILPFQKVERWSDFRETYLIESILVDIPLNPIYLLETDTNEYEALNGKEALTAFCKLFDNKIIFQNHFDLKPNIKDKTLQELDCLQQDRLTKRTCIRVITINKTSDKQLRAEIVKMFNSAENRLIY